MIDETSLAALFDAAAGARARAYAPYSGFSVGAAVLGAGGAIFAGCNVENAAYPVGACAEVGALSAMVAGGETRLAAILVIGGGAGLCTPCGACRQRIREFAGPDAAVVIAGPEGVRRRFTAGELLPESFGPEILQGARP
ncbi:cytidine deaminase [Chenggangzhangella methanolivorans]|uniref:Cytidine deaminase n=1 Tax=Chenggangzhangella methanolivorans TaxID=1437009 RepID=A0A9E6RCA5_9HYPH|nr:cytidine deaminase [Chenggangzhangella methanolivorans]QZO02198.1 cytidine deaminase [Chenggangzhangella methanolivorans]